MTDQPGWIELLFQRCRAGHWLHTAFLVNISNRDVLEAADAQPDGREELRLAALAELASDDQERMSLALLFLGVVGVPDDLSQVETFLEHSSDLVRRSAKVSRFELEKIRRANPFLQT